MNTLKFTLTPALIVLSAYLVAGCAKTISAASPDLLAFLVEEETTREEIITTLGQPSGTYELDTILAYRIGYDSSSGYFKVGSTKSYRHWHGERYSLVLLLDENGILKKKRLVDVKY